MKPFKINRESWHYKLNTEFFNEFSSNDEIPGPHKRVMEKLWEPKHSDFCSYWQATVLRITVIIASILTVCAVLYFISFLVINYHQELVTFLILIAGVTIVMFILEKVYKGVVSFFSKEKPKKEKPESLIAQKYRAHKAKICPMVEYED